MTIAASGHFYLKSGRCITLWAAPQSQEEGGLGPRDPCPCGEKQQMNCLAKFFCEAVVSPLEPDAEASCAEACLSWCAILTYNKYYKFESNSDCLLRSKVKPLHHQTISMKFDTLIHQKSFTTITKTCGQKRWQKLVLYKLLFFNLF